MGEPKREQIGTVVTVMTEDQLHTMIDKAIDAKLAALEPANREDGYLDTTGAADKLGTTVRGLQALIARGRIKPDIYGQRGAFRSHRFLRSTLDGYLASKQRDKGSV